MIDGNPQSSEESNKNPQDEEKTGNNKENKQVDNKEDSGAIYVTDDGKILHIF